jgi:hypothetical protein
MSIFSSSSHLECFERDLPNDHTCLVWFSGFRGEDLNVKVYDVGLFMQLYFRIVENCLWAVAIMEYDASQTVYV